MSKKKAKSRIKNQQISVAMFPKDETTIGSSPLEAFPEHAQLITYVIAEWSQIEYRLALWLARRLSKDKHVILPMIYALETSRARLDIMAPGLRQLISEPRVQGRLDKLLGEASQFLNLRNRYAHGHFGQDADSGELAIAGMGKKSPINIPLHELKDHCGRMKPLPHQLSVILAAELGLPLKGPVALDSVPAHPLGLSVARDR